VLGLFLPRLRFHAARKRAPHPSPPLPYAGCHQTASYSPKMGPLHFCTSGSEKPLTEEPSLYKRPCPPPLSHSVSTANTLSGALCLRPLPSASRTSSQDCYRPYHPRPSHLLAVLPLPSSPAAVAGRCATRQSRAVGPVRHFRLTLHKTDPPQNRWQDGDLEQTSPTAHNETLSTISKKIGRRRSYEETSRPFNQEQHQRA
jgi:hypothetical protein